MITYPNYILTGCKWMVDWSSFEEKLNGKNKKIDQVYATLELLKKSTYKKELLSHIMNDKAFKLISEGSFTNGTMLQISGLRDEWTESSVSRIYENLELLTPPDGEHKIFIWLIDSSNPDKFGLVENFEFTDFDYKVAATYKKNKEFKVNIEISRNEFDVTLIDPRLFKLPDMKQFPFDSKTFKKEHYKISKTFSELIRGWEDRKGYAEKIGDFQFTFYFLKNTFTRDDKDKYKYKEFTTDRSAWLRKFGGVKLYRDNFRIRPYGDTHTQGYDWLNLGERHGQNPAGASRKGGFRIRANQIAGSITFSRLTNPFLEDKSSREGLIENDIFEVFKNLLLGIIKVQEDDRSTVFASLNELYKITNPKQQIIEESQRLAQENELDLDTPEETKDKNRTLKSGIIIREQQLKVKDEEIAISRAMATAGIMIASFSHEFLRIRNALTSRTNNLKKQLEPLLDIMKLQALEPRKNPLNLIKEIEKTDNKLRQWVEFTIDLTRRERRKIKEVNIIDYFGGFSLLWSTLFKERKVTFKLNYVKSDRQLLTVKISELDLDTILDNLITNSIEAFERNGFSGKKLITIDISNEKKQLKIAYKDSGPGIDKSFTNINDIFIPFETNKRDDEGNEIGTGLGMWLVKSAIDANKGKAILHKATKGFEISILLNTINLKK